MPGLKLFLLGPPRFERDGQSLPINRRKAAALLIYLAMTRQSHSRDALATLFWPEADQSRARATLRRVLSDLHKGLGDGWLETEGETVAFRTGAELWLDVEAFRSRLAATSEHGHRPDAPCEDCLALLAEAVTLYGDEFLAGFTLPDCPAFDEWQFFETEQLRQELAQVLAQLVSGHVSRQDFEAAIPYARRWLALDPLIEAPHRALMELYTWTGQRNAALRQYQECERLLAEALNVPPSDETKTLYERIRRGELERPTSEERPAEPRERERSDLVLTSNRQPSTSTPPAEDEVRPVTVLCADLSSTMAAGELEPEELAELAGALQRLGREIATRYEARLDSLAGSGLQLVFGLPRMHEDDPIRAVRAGLDLQAAARQNGLSLAVGLSTGPVYFNPAGPAGSAAVVVGPVLNLAARLQAAAGAGQILVDPATYRQARRAFVFKARPVNMVGQTEPADAYEAGPALARPERVRGIEGLQTRLVGRDEEFSRLKTALADTLAGQGRIVALVGEAGLGKSRLIHELKQVALASPAAAPLWLEGRCLEFRQATSYWPFIDLLHSYLAGCSGDAGEWMNCLKSTLAGLVRAGSLPAGRAEEMALFLGNLLSIGAGDWRDRLKNTSREQVRHQTLTAVTDFLAAVARQQPLVLVLEDLHWADDLSLDLLALLLDAIATGPLLLLAVYRPERQHKSGRMARMASQKYAQHYTEIRLQELTGPLSQRLVESLLGAEGLPPAVADLVLEKAQGNPFFIEEAVRALIETGALYQAGGQWQTRPDMTLAAVPESVQSVILSRVDGLAADLRQVLQHAAVMGRLFRPKIIARTLPPDLDLEQALWALEEAALIYPDQVVPEVEYSFKHALTQEAIYHSLPRQRRGQLHRQVAEVMEELYAGNLRAYYEQLAYHYYHSPAAEKAIEYLIKAGQKSSGAYFNDEAIRSFQKALQRLEELMAQAETARPEWLAWQLAALTGLGELYHGMGRESEAEGYLRQAIDVGQQAGIQAEEMVRLYYWLSEALHWLGRHSEQINLGETGLSLLGPEQARSVEAVLMNQTMAIGHYTAGQPALFQFLTQYTAEFIRDLPYSEVLRPAYLHIIINLEFNKQTDQSVEWIEWLEKLAEEHYDLRALAEAHEYRWWVNFQRGRLYDTDPHFDRATDLYTQIGDNMRLWRCLGSMAWNFLQRGDLAEARLTAAQEMEIARQIGDDTYIAQAWFNTGVIRLTDQAWTEAAAAFDQAVRLTDDQHWLRWLVAYGLGRVYLAQDNRAAAREQFQTALAHFKPHGWTYWRFRWWPLLAGILSGLEAAGGDLEQTRVANYSHLSRASQEFNNFLPEQWLLRPADRPEPLALRFQDSFDPEPGPGWHWLDPLGDCHHEEQAGVAIYAANGRDLWYINRSAPRLGRPAAGDFAIQAVCGPAGAGRPAIGGLYIYRDHDNFLRLAWGQRGPREVSFEGCLDKKDLIIGRGSLPGPAVPPAVWLRLERQGDRVAALCSPDGEQWYSLGQAGWPDGEPLEIGLHAIGWIDRTVYPGAYPDGTAIRFRSFQMEG